MPWGRWLSGESWDFGGGYVLQESCDKYEDR